MVVSVSMVTTGTLHTDRCCRFDWQAGVKSGVMSRRDLEALGSKRESLSSNPLLMKVGRLSGARSEVRTYS